MKYELATGYINIATHPTKIQLLHDLITSFVFNTYYYKLYSLALNRQLREMLKPITIDHVTICYCSHMRPL